MLKSLESPFGPFFLRIINGSIAAAYFDDSFSPSLPVCPAQAKVLTSKILAYCSGFPLSPKGTLFQSKTWDCITTIKIGHTLSYKDLSIRMGIPGSVRAVASAVAQNPIAYLIPCHRIIHANGDAGGYRWNPLRKKMILDFEKVTLDK